jgi:hypothetical protein
VSDAITFPVDGRVVLVVDDVVVDVGVVVDDVVEVLVEDVDVVLVVELVVVELVVLELVVVELVVVELVVLELVVLELVVVVVGAGPGTSAWKAVTASLPPCVRSRSPEKPEAKRLSDAVAIHEPGSVDDAGHALAVSVDPTARKWIV